MCAFAVGVLAVVDLLSSVSIFNVGVVVAQIGVAAKRVEAVVLV